MPRRWTNADQYAGGDPKHYRDLLKQITTEWVARKDNQPFWGSKTKENTHGMDR